MHSLSNIIFNNIFFSFLIIFFIVDVGICLTINSTRGQISFFSSIFLFLTLIFLYYSSVHSTAQIEMETFKCRICAGPQLEVVRNYQLELHRILELQQ